MREGVGALPPATVSTPAPRPNHNDCRYMKHPDEIFSTRTEHQLNLLFSLQSLGGTGESGVICC